MVSMNPSLPEGFYLDANGVALPGLNPFSAPPPEESPATAATATVSLLDVSLVRSMRIEGGFLIKKY
uniref:Uncharacterized protein n=1 Tax=Chenopodium quinoa TaxID=63459 RepID=A0A803M063_CHEQI